MDIEKINNNSPEKAPKKKFKIGIEMEAYGKDGSEIEGGDLWENIIVEAKSEAEAKDLIFNKMYFGNRTPNGYAEIEEVKNSNN